MNYESVFFKKGCTVCKKTDGISNMISFTYEDIDNPFIENGKQIRFRKGFSLIEEFYLENEFSCDFCNAKNKFDFWDIKIGTTLIKPDTFPASRDNFFAIEFKSYEMIYYKYDFNDKVIIDDRETQMTINNNLESGIIAYNNNSIYLFIHSYDDLGKINGYYPRLKGKIDKKSLTSGNRIIKMEGEISNFANSKTYIITRNNDAFLEVNNESIDKEFISLRFLGETDNCEPDVNLEYLFYDLKLVGNINLPPEYL